MPKGIVALRGGVAQPCDSALGKRLKQAAQRKGQPQGQPLPAASLPGTPAPPTRKPRPTFLAAQKKMEWQLVSLPAAQPLVESDTSALGPLTTGHSSKAGQPHPITSLSHHPVHPIPAPSGGLDRRTNDDLSCGLDWTQGLCSFIYSFIHSPTDCATCQFPHNSSRPSSRNSENTLYHIHYTHGQALSSRGTRVV